MMIYNKSEKAFSFLLRVPYISEHRLDGLDSVPDGEKDNYFWVPLKAVVKAVNGTTDNSKVQFTYTRKGANGANEPVSVHLYSRTVSDLKTPDGARVFKNLQAYNPK